MHIALICLLLFLTRQSDGTRLKELYENQKTDMERQWLKEWNNISEKNSLILDEYIHLYTKPITNTTIPKNVNCRDNLNFGIMKSIEASLDENLLCRMKKLEAYSDFIDLILRSFNSSSLYESCYKNKYLDYEIFQCIDDNAMYVNNETQKSYQEAYNLMKDYNDVLTAQMATCINNFKASLEKSMNVSETLFTKCGRIEIRKNLKFNTTLINLYDSYKELLYLKGNKSQQIINRIHREELKNYQNELIYNITNKKKKNCCHEFSIKHIDIALNNALNQSKQCFQIKLMDFKQFINGLIKNSETKKLFGVCNNDDLTSLELSLICFDWVLKSSYNEAVETKYNLLLKTIKNHNEQLPSSIRSCLYKVINELRQFNLALKKEHVNCIKTKKYNAVCVDKPFVYDSNAMKVDSINLYTNEIVTDIIYAYQ